MEPNHGTDQQQSLPDALCLRETVAPVLWDRNYHGKRLADGVSEVWVEETALMPEGGAMICRPGRRSLPLRLDLISHSPTGFEWGYGGSGPAQLALALLMDALGDGDLALRYYQEFKRQKVANWGEAWTVSRREICAFVEAQPK